MKGPLDGLKILDLTRLQPGNYATMLLGDLGADVVKVEEPGRGDYVRWTLPMVGDSSAIHLVMNRNKRSVTLNLKTHGGKDLLKRLVKRYDVLIESFRPDVMDRLGVGYKDLAKENHALIYAAITGYGQDGPYKDRVGHDQNYIAFNGILNATGPRGADPVLPGVQIADLSGAMMAVVGILSALYRRGIDGSGEFIDVSMMDASLSWLALHLAQWFGGFGALERSAGFLNGGYPFYRVYRCADGRHVSVGSLEPQFWEALCKALDLEDLIPDQYAAPERQEEVHRILEDKFASKPRDEWVEELSHLQTCVAPINDFSEMAADPQVIARRMLTPSHKEGAPEWRQLGVPIVLANNPGGIHTEAPGLGEHNSEVYGEIGIDENELKELSSAGVI